MKKIIPYILFLSLTLFITACTHNGGPDGKLYGRWHLTLMEGDGIDVETPTRNMYWAFQADMILMQQETANHEYYSSYGIFRLDDNTLFLDFPEAKIPPLSESRLKRENILQVLKMTHSEMTLLYHPTADSSITYYFRKW